MLRVCVWFQMRTHQVDVKIRKFIWWKKRKSWWESTLIVISRVGYRNWYRNNTRNKRLSSKNYRNSESFPINLTRNVKKLIQKPFPPPLMIFRETSWYQSQMNTVPRLSSIVYWLFIVSHAVKIFFMVPFGEIFPKSNNVANNECIVKLRLFESGKLVREEIATLKKMVQDEWIYE